MNTRCAHGNVIVHDFRGLAGLAVVVAANPDQRSPIQSRGNQHRSILTHALAAQHDAGCCDLQAAKNLMPAFQQQHRAANAVRIGRKTGDVINRRLNSCGFVALDRSDNNTNGRIRDWFFSTSVTAG
jgi:hypothetical protein